MPESQAPRSMAPRQQSYRALAACYAHMGRLDEARAVVERLRAITPVVIPPSVAYLRKPEHRELLLSGLRSAMPRCHSVAQRSASITEVNSTNSPSPVVLTILP